MTQTALYSMLMLAALAAAPAHAQVKAQAKPATPPWDKGI